MEKIKYLIPVFSLKCAKSLSWTITDKDGDKWNPLFFIGSVDHRDLKAFTIILGPIHFIIGW